MHLSSCVILLKKYSENVPKDKLCLKKINSYIKTLHVQIYLVGFLEFQALVSLKEIRETIETL